MKGDLFSIDRRPVLLPMSSQGGLLLLRLLLGLVMALQVYFGPAPPAGWSWVRAVPPLYLAAACLIWRLRETGRVGDALGTGLFMADLAACLALAYGLDRGGNSLLTTLLLLILSSCLLQRPSVVLGVSAGAAVLYGLAALPPFPMSPEQVQLFYQRLMLFFLITLFGIHIADYAAQIERTTARRYEERLAWMQRLSMVGEAMAAVLHEAKTPLGTIVLNAESASSSLGRGAAPSEELRVIAQEADHATAILQNFLDFVKPTRLERAPLELQEPLLQALGMAKIRLDERGVALELRPLKDCPVRGSARHLVQAFSNVIGNAVDAMPDGGKLLVRMEKRAGSALVHFEDTGVGMSREALGRLFETFTTSKTGGEGHGLGLSIVRWIAQEHEGEVLVESPGTGRGAHVTLVLPLDLQN